MFCILKKFSLCVCLCWLVTQVNSQFWNDENAPNLWPGPAPRKSSKTTSCLNPNQRRGSCISIYDCQTVMSIVQRSPLQQSDLDFVKASACSGGFGRTPHVCCSSDTGYVQPDRNFRESPTKRGQKARETGNLPVSSSNSQAVVRPVTNTGGVALLPEPPACGGVSIETKIYGGSDAELNEFPWLVLLEYRRLAGGFASSGCGGALINQRYVLTAAHCVTGQIIRDYKLNSVRLGEHDVTQQQDCNGQKCAPESYRVGIEQIIAHEDYKEASMNKENDIALLQLDRNVHYSDVVRPICLPSVVRQERQQPETGTKYTVAGWGRTLKQPRSAIVQKLQVELVDQQQCMQRYSKRKVQIVEGQLCAGGKFAEDSCEGDSGGPLMRFRNGAWVLEGVVSFGVKCGLEDWPAVHTRVAQYDSWIRGKLRA